MNRLPRRYASPNDLPFNSSCLKGSFLLQAPDADPGGEGVWLALAGHRLLVADTQDMFTLPDGLCSLPPLDEPLYIGQWHGRPCRLAHVPKDIEPPVGCQTPSLIEHDPQLPIELLTLGGMGRMILHWEHSSRHCGNCGTLMRRLPGEWGKHCPACGTHHHPRIHPCVIVVVTDGDRVLLSRKPDWAPRRYSLVAGFLEFGESLEEAVMREVREETGVDIRNVRYLGSQCWPFPSQVMCGFVAEYASGELVVQESELEDARWFPLDELPKLPPKRSIARYILDTVLELP